MESKQNQGKLVNRWCSAVFGAALMGGSMVSGVSSAQTFYVATDGDDGSGDGSIGAPWATITRALDTVADASTILVRPGTYFGRVRLRGTFANGVTVRSEIPYQARLRYHATVVTCFYGRGITLEGFDIAHDGPGASGLVIQVQDLLDEPGGSDFVGRITFRDNVLHDSFNNDILKINNGAGDITVEGNLFYNQTGSDEHIDVNSVTDVTIQDNVFFNDFAGSGRANGNDTSAYIVIKDSNGSDDTNLGSERITVRRNVFLNWEGSTGANFVLVGEDGQPFYEARQVIVENNLMIGNSSNVMRSAFGVKGGTGIVFRYNTVVGDLPSLAYAMRLNTEGSNPPNDDIFFENNIWSDPTGTMGAENPSRPNDFSDTPSGETIDYLLDNNLYWNGGATIPSSSAELVNYTDDLRRTVADPRLRDPVAIVLPRYLPSTNRFADGAATIREVFVNLVELYAATDPASPVIDAAVGPSPASDILGNPRPVGTGADLGAWELQSAAPTFSLDVTRSGTGAGSVASVPSGVSCGEDCSHGYADGTSVTLTATPVLGARFSGWSGDCSGTDVCVFSMTVDRSVDANFTNVDFRTLTVATSGGGTGMIVSELAGIQCGSDCSESYPHNTVVTLTAIPTHGAMFVEWTGACGDSDVCIVTMTDDVSAEARFIAAEIHGYRVTVENLSSGQALTAPVVATHARTLRLYRPRRASTEIQALAENGDSAPLLTWLGDDARVAEIATGTTGPLVPRSDPGGTLLGSSTNIIIGADPGAEFLSLASMVVCTNDGFTGLNRVRLPTRSVRVYFPGVSDAGTEINTEDFADLVPACQFLLGFASADAGTFVSNPALAERAPILPHSGVSGGADLIPSAHGWVDPIVRITVTPLRAGARKFRARLNGGQVVVQDANGNNAFVVTDAEGTLSLRLRRGDMELQYKLVVSSIVDVTEAHIRSGLPNENGPIVATLYGPADPDGSFDGRLARGKLTEADLSGPYAGDLDGFLAALGNGELYVSVHTSTNPGGEIRGRIGAR